MVWKAKTGTDVLSSIVATLLSLAALAERLGDMPCDVRRRVFAVLLHAEIVAHASLFDVARDYGAPALPLAEAMASLSDGDSPSEAELLALRLRTLALLWFGLVTWLQSAERRQTRGLQMLGLSLAHAAGNAHRCPAYPVARPRIDSS